MNKKGAILFDFDGVIADTEPLYDIFINELGIKYDLGIDDFASKVKGVPIPDIVQKYFSHLDAEKVEQVKEELLNFETTMDIPPIDGALEFIAHLRKEGYRLGLVTSSQLVKMQRALKLLGLEDSFESIVTANRITKGKPDPMCFLLAAEDLGVDPKNCIVFEDSIHGINAGLNAEMRVIGLTTSFGEDRIKDMVFATLSDFTDIEKVMSLINHK